MSYPQCIVCFKSVGWIGLITNVALSILKVFVGLISGSHALVIESMYSLKDVVTSALILLGLRLSKQPIDEEHQFGHGKAEFIFSLIVGLTMITLTGIFLYFAASLLIEGAHKPPHLIALWTAVFVLGVSVFLTYYTRCVAFQVNSPMVKVLSQHQSSDGSSAFAVACGIIGSHYLGMPWLDTVVAISECLHLVYLGGEIVWDSIHGLMDAAAPQEVVEKIRRLASTVSGVKTVEEIRTRQVGQEIWVDLVIGVDPDLSIQQAKEIGVWVEEQLIEFVPHIGNVGAHFKSASGSLPELQQMQQEVAQFRDHLEQQSVRAADEQAGSDKPVGGVAS
ncbi:MAG: magnetosome biogenesis CDF transporter MamM [Magnetococcales bacterium]|nr:magnetosome biogenesis CDF transporter MamM [Magnetococcales bacterium]